MEGMNCSVCATNRNYINEKRPSEEDLFNKLEDSYFPKITSLAHSIANFSHPF